MKKYLTQPGQRKLTCFLSLLLLLVFTMSATAQTDDFNQAENKNGAPNSYTIDWINGILNSTHTSYFEGMSVPQRHIYTKLGAGQHTLKIRFLVKKDVQHAYDFITSWDQAFAAGAYYGNGSVNELGRLFTDQCRSNTSVSAAGQAACPILAASAFVLNPEIPDIMGDGPFVGTSPAPDINGKIQIYENSIKGAGVGFGNRTVQIRASKAISGASVNWTGYDGDYATYTIVWTNSTANTDVLIRYAGHLSIGRARGGYGANLGAGSVSGGPYHFKFDNLYGPTNNALFTGAQDNQIMSGAIQIPPPPCAIAPSNITICSGDATPLTFTGPTDLDTYTWSISPNTGGVGFTGQGTSSITVTNPVAGTSYTITLATAVSGVNSTDNCTATLLVKAKPARPVITITEATLCGTVTKPKITVNCPVSGYDYTLVQGSGTPVTIHYSGTGSVVFENLNTAGGFSVTATDANGCTSLPTDCSNYTTNSCPVAPIAQQEAVSKLSLEPTPSGLKVVAAPNPFNNKIHFSLVSQLSGEGSLELYNMLGQKVKTVYQGGFEKGVSRSLDYAVPATQRASLIYIFRIGDQKVSGTLIGVK